MPTQQLATRLWRHPRWRHRGAEKSVPREQIHVVHFHRRPHETYFSVERLFATVRKHLPPRIHCDVAISRFESHSLFRRAYNVVEAAFRQGEVNHVTGDVHFLVYLMAWRRTVLTVHDCTLLEQYRGVRRWIYLFLWYALPVRCSAYVTVISECVKQELLSHVRCDPARIRVIHDPVSDDFPASPKEFNTHKPVILQVGTKCNKNLERVAPALTGIPCHLRIIGELSAEQKRALEQNGIEYSSVSNISDEQVVDEYVKCDMAVFASTYEGFGMPIVEANAVGRPVVTSNLPPMPEVAGDAACLVDPLDVDSIRQGVLKVMEDMEFREAIVERGFANAKRFCPSVISQQYAGVYEDVLNGLRG